MTCRIIILIAVLVISSLVHTTSSQTTCENNILRFSKTGEIKASATEAVAGDSITVTCTSQCVWLWHQFTINGESVSDGFSPAGNQYTISAISNEIMNCSTCSEPSQQICSDSSQGPVTSTVNVTFTSSGAYYFQCRTALFQFNFWPNKVIKVYSEVLQVQVQDKPLVPATSISLQPTTASIYQPSATTSTPVDTPLTAVTTTTTPVCATVTVTVTASPTTNTDKSSLSTTCTSKSSSLRTEPTGSLTVDVGRVSQDGCDSSNCNKFSYTDMMIVIIALSIFCGLLLFVTVCLVTVLCCCMIGPNKGIGIFDKVYVVSKSPSNSVSGDSGVSINRIDRLSSTESSV